MIKTFAPQNNNIPNNSLTFKSGLNQRVLKYVENTNVRQTEKYFENKGIKADFQGNKAIAACAQLTTKIFEKLNLPLPPEIRATSFKKYNIHKNAIGVCYYQSGERIPGKKSEARSVFMNTDYMKDIYHINRTEDSNKGHASSTHFLASFIHEFLHSAHYDKAYKKFGFNGEIINKSLYKKSNSNYDGYNFLIRQKFKHQPNRIIGKQVSQYAKTNRLELLAELHSRIIIDSLDKRESMLPLPIKNPFVGKNKISPGLSSLLKDIWFEKD